MPGCHPNTAENKLMQYAASGGEDGEGSCRSAWAQRVLDAMKKNELSYIFPW